MTNQEKKQENILVKLYILALFLCGIGLWFAVSGAPKEKLSVDVELEQKVVDALTANGVKQTDIILQYARERETTKKIWSEFYKKVQLHGNKRSDNFENSLRAIARSMKLGLSRTENVDGTVTYKFYSSGENYSNITFVNPKKPASSSSSKAVPKSGKKTDAQTKEKTQPAPSAQAKPAAAKTSSSQAKSTKSKTQAKAKK